MAATDMKDASLDGIARFERAFTGYSTQLQTAVKKMEALTQGVGARWKDPDYLIMRRIVGEIAVQMHSVDNLNKTVGNFLQLKRKIVAEKVNGRR
ncbi:MAG: hypothetical protein WCJ02_07740 [bacterium]